MSNFQGLLNAVGLGAGAMNQTALDNHIMRQQQASQPPHEAQHIWESKMDRAGYDRGGGLEDAFKYAMQNAFGAAPRAVKPARAAPAPDPNDIASLKMPLSTLKDVWAAKWGDQWVTPSTTVSTEDLPFWRNAFERLRQQELFELFDLSGTVWYRLKEENGS